MTTPFSVRPLQPDDSEEWMQMRRALWQDYSESEMRADMKKWLSTPTNATFVLLDAEKQLCGFIEVGSRNYADQPYWLY